MPRLRLTFDRGTVVLHAPPGWAPALAETSLVWDDRVAAFRAPADRLVEVRLALQRAGVTVEDEASRLSPAPLRMRRPDLRPYQEEAVAAWEMAGRRGVVVLPTGSGKTRVALAAMAEANRSTLVLVPTRALMEQWVAALGGWYAGRPGRYGDGFHELRRVTVSTFDSAFRHMDGFGDRFSLVVVDEVHHFASGARSEVLQMAVAPWRLGLTATPPAAHDRVERLRALVGPIACHRTVAEMVGDPLAPFEHIVRFVALRPDERRGYDAGYLPFAEAFRTFARDRRDGAWSEFVRAASATSAGRCLLAGHRAALAIVARAAEKLAAAEQILRRHHGQRALVFTADNDTAYEVSARLLVPAVTCDIRGEERRAVLERFHRGDVRALVSSRVLNEGLDVPEASLAVVLGGRMGAREHVQRVGRVLRPRPGKRALVYELVARDTVDERHHARRAVGLTA